MLSVTKNKWKICVHVHESIDSISGLFHKLHSGINVLLVTVKALPASMFLVETVHMVYYHSLLQ